MNSSITRHHLREPRDCFNAETQSRQGAETDLPLRLCVFALQQFGCGRRPRYDVACREYFAPYRSGLPPRRTGSTARACSVPLLDAYTISISVP